MPHGALAEGALRPSGDRVVFNRTTLSNVLVRAFELKFSQQVAGPSWVFENRYDIVAKAPDNTPKDQIPRMLQTLLIERFQLALHHETRELPAYVLVVGKGRLKLIESGAPEKNGVAVNEGHREMKSTSMELLARMASQTLRAPVLDQTGLAGFYDFPYHFSMEEMGGMTSQTAASDKPSIFTIMENLGLKLESRKAPFDVLVIDRGNPTPAGN